ncbi:glycosyl hydrolase 115 family protein [Microbacterium sp. SS28]|uniref:glycosyl hydrolase 115 family protein n=1 Tax=Microbacterium sp. SS28 TaxID=2919948 RepID=UPI001FAA1E97|nr:glycosyl hydrolase 115 family protein [Microbacterium sp. SS28]
MGPTTQIAGPVLGVASTSYIVDDPAAGATIATRGGRVAVSVAPSEDAAVHRAVDDLIRDVERVCGATGTIAADSGSAGIVVGTIGKSPEIDAAIAAGTLDISGLMDEDGSIRWEGFIVAAVGGVLYLVGADRRGTIYAIYDFTEAIGVSPWYWWGDVPIRTREHITVTSGTARADWPSVRYRGVFLNDEEELYHWARTHTPDSTIGPATYVRIFELLLRLKGNYLWAAMHVDAFNDDPENGRLADEMGVVIGTQHCDMLLRSNEHEFRPWAERRGEHVEYDYSMPGRNRELLKEYWRGSVQQNRSYEVTWTVGMRGVHDSGFVTTAIDDNPDLNDAEKLTARVQLLEKVIHDQRDLLADELGMEPSQIPQLFIPYKEVLPLYDAGLQVPDDVTVVWANDSFGYIRRLPDEAERTRRGGHGLYYHSSYWSNFTTSYLATSSTPLTLMKSELRRAWDGGIRQLWVDNIGGLKPLEIEMEFFLRSAWEAGKESTTADIPSFTAQWIDAKFTGGIGDRAGEIYAAYYQLNNQRKIEHLASDVFPQVGYGDEAGRRLSALRLLHDQTNALLASLPADERDAFFELFAVKIQLAYLTNAEFYYADRSTLCHRQGKAAAADRYVALSRAFGRSIRALIHHYNQHVAGGRWDGMFTPQEFPPPVMPMHPAATPALTIGDAGLGVVVWGVEAPHEAQEITFWPSGISTKWIEVFNTGSGTLRFHIDADPWIRIDPHPTTVDTETRIAVRIDPGGESNRSGTIRVTAPDTGQTVEIGVRIAQGRGDAVSRRELVEADGYVSIDPAADGRSAAGANARWVQVPHLGRYANSAMRVQRGADLDGGSSANALIEFDVHLVTPGVHTLEVHRLPTLDSTGRLRMEVSIDDHPPTLVESPTTDEHRGSWSANIQDNIERLRVELPALEAGTHRLRLHAVDSHFTISKVVVYTADIPPSNLGPSFSRRAAAASTADTDINLAALDPDDIDRAARDLYRIDPRELPAPHQAYADHTFWDGPTTFRIPKTQSQSDPAHSIDEARPRGRKDVVSALGTGVIREQGGVLAFEAEYALAEDSHAWLNMSVDERAAQWSHTHADTAAGTGLAMHVRPRGMRWEDPATAPGMHFALHITRGGTYRAWLLVKFDDNHDDSCVIAVDGIPQPVSAQHSRGELCAYGLRQRWIWVHLSDVDLTTGAHEFSVLARKSGLRVDRLYLTLGDELPPVDAEWTPSPRGHLGATREERP